MAIFHKRTWTNDDIPDLDEDTLNELEKDIQSFGDDIMNVYAESDESVSYKVTESTTIFQLPNNVDNYADNKFYITCEIDGVETTNFTLGEQAYVPILTLATAISSGTVVIRAVKFKSSFLNFLNNNGSVG